MIKKLLYLTYIDLDNLPTSGSSVRPLKMKKALERLDIEVRTFGGMSNDIPCRRKTVSEIRKMLKNWRPDACYIEPPSGPLFYFGDIALVKHLHRLGIRTSIFYRDAYWKYPEYYLGRNSSVKERLKHSVIKKIQLFQWNVFRKNIDIIYFPSETMAKEFDCPKKDVLPPGADIPDITAKSNLSNPLQFIFVGGAARNYGTFLTIDAFEELNCREVKAKLFYICPKKQWESLGIDKEKHKKWLEVIHTSGEENLKYYYERADVALLTAPRTFYRDFAVPVKIFEYISYLKPILVTNCTETAKIIKENEVGWIVNDDVESVVEQLMILCSHPEEIIKVKNKIVNARSNNLWIRRAEKVIRDLDGCHH